jgi:tetratricopeptide (TPR) repeat protein
MATAMTTALSWRPFAAIVVTAFAVKFAVLMQLWDHPLLQPHGELDTAYYVALGQRVANESVLAPIGAFFVSPLYVYFLAAVFAIGGTLFTAQVVQIGLGAIGAGMLYATALHWFGHRAAVVGASLAILNGVFTFNEVLILQSALDPFLVACTLFALTRAISGGGTGAFAGAGVSLALLALNRPNALVFAVAAMAGVFVLQWRRRTLAPAAALMMSLVAVLAANAARNYAVSGDVVLIASHGGLNFYIGNHDRADGTYTPVPGITPSIAGQARDSTRVAESKTGRRLTPGEVSDYFVQRALDWMIAHPADAARLTLRKAGILLNRVDVPLNYSYEFYAREPFSLLRFLAAGAWLLIPFGLVGLFWPSLRANRSGYWVWAMFVPVYGAAVVAFFVTDRYRMPMFVPLCATAGAALVRFFDLLRIPNRPNHLNISTISRPAGAVALCALVAFANLGLDGGVGSEQTRKAVWLVEQGSFDEARQYFDQVKGAHSHPGVLRFRVGSALLDTGRAADAAPLLADAMTIDGPRPAIQLALVRALVLAGRRDDAVKQLGYMPVAVAEGDQTAEIALDFGTLALEHNAAAEAIRWLQVAVKQAPDRAEAQEKLGLAMFLSGDPKAAVSHLERARQLDSSSASANLNLAAVYAQLGMFAAARSLASEALRLDPDEPRAAALLKALPQ